MIVQFFSDQFFERAYHFDDYHEVKATFYTPKNKLQLEWEEAQNYCHENGLQDFGRKGPDADKNDIFRELTPLQMLLRKNISLLSRYEGMEKWFKGRSKMDDF